MSKREKIDRQALEIDLLEDQVRQLLAEISRQRRLLDSQRHIIASQTRSIERCSKPVEPVQAFIRPSILRRLYWALRS